MPIRSIADLRNLAGPQWDRESDESLIHTYAGSVGMDPTEVAIRLGYAPGSGGVTSKRGSAAVDNYQAGLYGLGEAATGALGLKGAEGWMRSGRQDNELAANVASQRAKEMGAVDAWKDVHSPSDFGSYAAGLGIQSLPYMAEAAVGGVLGRGAAIGARASLGAATEAGDAIRAAEASRKISRAGLAGGTAASYPSAVADVLGNQREENGTTDLGAAAALGVPYAALNSLGETGLVMRGKLLPKNTIKALADATGIKGAALRGLSGATRTGLEEGTGELGQEMLNQAGRIAVNPAQTMFNPQANDRYKESFAGGATLGGIPGAGAAIRGRATQPVATPSNTPEQPPLQIGYSEHPTAYTTFPDGSVGSFTDKVDQHRAQLFDQQFAPQPAKDSFDFVPGTNYMPPAAPVMPGYADPNAIPFEPTSLLPGAARPRTTQTQIPGVQGQMGLFSGLDDVANSSVSQDQQAADSSTQEQGPSWAPPEQGNLFAPNPRDQEITAALRNANGGRMTASLARFVQAFKDRVANPSKLDEFLQTADVPTQVLDTAIQLAEARLALDSRVKPVVSLGQEITTALAERLTLSCTDAGDAAPSAFQEKIVAKRESVVSCWT